MKITIDRLKHSLAVANKMKEIVENESNKYSFDSDAAFVLGLLHDIGYAFSNNPNEHAIIGGKILKEQGYKYWKEVFYHGVLQFEYQSLELNLLNYVDLMTSPTGEYITIQERIEDISKRYGKNSFQENEAKKLFENLKKEFLNN